MMTIVGLGLTAAIVYGTSDFLGGFAARRLPSLQVTLVAFVAGTAMSAICLLLVASRWSAAAIGYGALAGVAAAVSIWLLYEALSIGPVSVLAPMVAVIAALFPVLYGLGHGEHLGTAGEAAIAMVLLAAILVAYDPGGRGATVGPRALIIGVAAGVVTGAYLVSLDLTPADSGAAPVLVEFAVGAVLLGSVVLSAKVFRASPRRQVFGNDVLHAPGAIAVVSGVTQAVADVLVIVGIHRGDLAVMAALMALYPLGTIACARIVAPERVARTQIAGVVLAIAASALLSTVARAG